MKNESELSAQLKDHEKRIAHLESLLLKRKSIEKLTEKRTLQDFILELRDKGFFSQPKTANEIHSKLQGSYHCEIDRVAMAMLRLADKKQLRKATKSIEKKIYQAYVW